MTYKRSAYNTQEMTGITDYVQQSGVESNNWTDVYSV